MLTTTEAAARLGMPVRTVRWLCLQEGIGVKHGRDYLIDPADLVRFPRRKVGRPRKKKSV